MAAAFPVLAVKAEALTALRATLSPASEEKPPEERERATLLVIIAALAKKAGIDYSKPSTAGKVIERL